MRIAFNPSTVEALITPPNNKDITFDLRGRNIFARGVKFCGTDTNTWRDIKINNVSIDSNILDLRNGSNTTLTNTNGVVTINSTWRPVVDNLTSDSTTSSLSANLGRILKALIDGKSDSDHNHDDRYVKKTGDTMLGALNFANNTWNKVGDDVYIGDHNIGGQLCIMGANGTTGLSFHKYGDASIRKSITFDGNTLYMNGSCDYATLSNLTNLLAINTVPNKTAATSIGSWSPISGRYVFHQKWTDTSTGSDSANFGIYLDGNLTANMVLDGYYNSLLGFRVIGATGGFLKANGTIDNSTYLTSHLSLSNYYTKSEVDTKLNSKLNYRLFWERTNIDLNSITEAWHTYEVNNGTDTANTPTNASWHQAVLWGTGDTNYAVLLCTAYTSNYSLYLRHKIAGKWYDWIQLATTTDIPGSLKNPYALTISLNGTSQGPYDGSAAKNINITPSSISAATSGHNHDGRYVYNYGGTQMDGASINKNALGMTTNSGITGDWWHILQAAWNGEYRWNSLIAFPTLNRNGMYYRSGLDDNTAWGSWVKLLDINNYSSVLDIRYITDITTSVNKLTFTKNGSNITRDITVNVVHNLGNLTNIPDKDATTKAGSGLYIYNSYGLTIGTNSYSSVLSINTGGTIQIAGNWGDDLARNLYWRSLSDRAVASYPWKSWRTILDSENYSFTLDSRYYTETEVNSLLDAKLNRQNLSYGTWNPRGYNLAADYNYNGGDLSISESGGKIHISVDGYFWLNEGQYRVLDTSDVAGLKNNLTVHLYLSNTDTTWWPLIWGGSSHNNTSDSTGTVYKSYDKLSWLTSSLTLYATNIQTNNIKNLSVGGGIYWNPYVESTTDGSDAASITLVKSGVAGGTTLVLSLMNDASDTILFKTNGSARLYHNSYPILTTLNTYVSNNKGYINGTEITLVNNADTIDGWHKNNILWTGYITSPDSLSSYWFKMYDITVTGYLYSDITITFLISEGYSAHFSIFHLRIRLNGTGNGNYALDVTLRELVGNLRDKIVAYYNNSTGNVLLWGNTGGRWNTMNYTILKKTTRTDIDLSSIGTLTAQGFSSVQTPPSTGYTKLTMARVGSVSYSDSTGSVHWNNVTNKPSTFSPAAHTHTVFKNNLMIKGTNGVSDSASIHLGIGDSDTGFKWISDGKCLIYANNSAVGEWTSGGMNWFKNPTVNGSKVWNAGNDGSGSGLDADTLDGYHASSLWRSDGGIWNPSANISLTASGNNQEWSFDIRRNNYTGCYWHVWDSALNTLLKVNADNGKVYAPYNFVGNLEGNASSATALTTNAGNSINPVYFSGGKPIACTMSTGRGNGIVRSFSRGTYKSANLYFGNGTIVAIDPIGTGCISANDTILSLGDLAERNTQLLVAYDRDGVYYRRITDNLNYGNWKRLAFTTDNVASASKLATARSIWGHSFNGTADVNGTIYINNNNSSEGAIRLNNNINSNARISAIDSQVIFNTDAAIRFGGTSWDWNVWAGLKYTHSNKTIYLGIADNSIFNANSALSGGSLRFPGISNVYATTFNGSLSGNAATATKLTSSAGNATLPIYFSDGKPIACTASSIFSNLSNSGNNLSITVAGQNRTLTVAYASTTSKLISRGKLTAYEEGSTTKGESGVNLYTVYSNGYPVTYGNLLHINGSGAGQLLAEWCGSSTLGHLYYRSKRDNSDNGWSAWGKIAFVTDNVASATKVIVNLHTTSDTNYPLVWSNLANTNTVTENQLYKSWSDLYYNPKNKRLTVGGSIYAAHFYESSDKALKKNIKSILSSTNIPKIREFDWKDTGEHSYGFIALELEELGYDCLVSEANGKKTVNYTATLALTVAKLLNLINIQNKKISNLTKELKALKYGRKKNS